MAYANLNPALHTVYQQFTTVCLSAIIYSWSVTVSVMNAACYDNIVKYQLVHDFLVYEC